MPGALSRLYRRYLIDAAPAFLVDVGTYLPIFVIKHFLDAVGASSAEVALVFGTYTCAYAVAALLLGRASDRLGRRGSTLAGAVDQHTQAAPYIGCRRTCVHPAFLCLIHIDMPHVYSDVFHFG